MSQYPEREAQKKAQQYPSAFVSSRKSEDMRLNLTPVTLVPFPSPLGGRPECEAARLSIFQPRCGFPTSRFGKWYQESADGAGSEL